MWNSHSYTQENYNHAEIPAYSENFNSYASNSQHFPGSDLGSYNGPSMHSSNYYSSNSPSVDNNGYSTYSAPFSNSESYSNNQHFSLSTYQVPPPPLPVHYSNEYDSSSYNYLLRPIGPPPVPQHNLEPVNMFYNNPMQNSYPDNLSQHQARLAPSNQYFNAEESLPASSHNASQNCQSSLPQTPQPFYPNSNVGYFSHMENTNYTKTYNYFKQEKKKFCSSNNLIVIKSNVGDINKCKSHSLKPVFALTTVATSNSNENDNIENTDNIRPVSPKLSIATCKSYESVPIKEIGSTQTKIKSSHKHLSGCLSPTSSYDSLSKATSKDGNLNMSDRSELTLPPTVKSSSTIHTSSKIIENVLKNELSDGSDIHIKPIISMEEGNIGAIATTSDEIEAPHLSSELSLPSSGKSDTPILGKDAGNDCSVPANPSVTSSSNTKEIADSCNIGVISSILNIQNSKEELPNNRPIPEPLVASIVNSDENSACASIDEIVNLIPSSVTSFKQSQTTKKSSPSPETHCPSTTLQSLSFNATSPTVVSVEKIQHVRSNSSKPIPSLSSISYPKLLEGNHTKALDCKIIGKRKTSKMDDSKPIPALSSGAAINKDKFSMTETHCPASLLLNSSYDSLSYREDIPPSWPCNVMPIPSVNIIHNSKQQFRDFGLNSSNYNCISPNINLNHHPSSFYCSLNDIVSNRSANDTSFNIIDNTVVERSTTVLNDQLGGDLAHKSFNSQNKYFSTMNNNDHLISEELNFISKNNRILNEHLKAKDSRYSKKNSSGRDMRNSKKTSKFSSSNSSSHKNLTNGFKEPLKIQRSKSIISPMRSRTSKPKVHNSQDMVYKPSKNVPENVIKSSGQATKGVKRKTRSPSSSRSDKKFLEYNDDIPASDRKKFKFKLGSNERKLVKNSTAKKLDDSPERSNGNLHTDEASEVNDHGSDSTPWIRSSPADLYYQRDPRNPSVITATRRLQQLCEKFESRLVKRSQMARENAAKERDEKITAEKSILNQKDTSTITSCISAEKPTVIEENEKSSTTNQDSITINNDSCFKNCDSGKCNSECGSSNKISNSKVLKYKKSERSCGKSSKSSASKCKTKCGKSNSNSSWNAKSKSLQKKNIKKPQKCLLSDCSSSDSEDLNHDSSSSSSCASEDDEYGSKGLEEMEKKKKHPDRMHEELWYNDPGEMNDYPLCRCSLKARRSGIKHGYYVGEDPLNSCDNWTNNADKLHHYFIAISPPTNFLVKSPTTITYDNHEFIFEGFSILSHFPLEEIPTCQVIRFNIEYSVYCVSEKIPDNFCVKELDLVYEYLFKEILELVDLNFKAIGDDTGCPRFHLLPRFVRKLPDSGKEVLSMNEVLSYLLRSSVPLVKEEELSKLLSYSERDWLNYTDQVKGMIVTYPGKKPCSIRVDQLDREQLSDNTINFPVIVHFGIRPPQLSYAGNPQYQKALREYVKFRHLLANMPKPSYEHKRQLETKENRLQSMRMANSMKKEVTVDVSSEGFYRTGIMCDMVQHALLIPVLVRHLRFHRSLTKLEESINYSFKNRYLLQLALTHPSYRENFGTNPDHARNSLTNCGVRQPQYGDKNIQYMNTHKRGINTLVNIMSRFGKKEESESKITHNERLEFLGDAVVEFLSSIHLFHLFPSLEEGGLATYRAALVQNQHLSVLAEKLELDKFVLHAHGSDLCHTFVLRHAMANCFEALMGAIFIDSSIEEADSVFSTTLFKGEPELMDIWINYKPHPLQEQEPAGDRHWIERYPVLQKLVKFEESIGIEFRHIRLLARCFTDRSIGYNYLTLGSNQRLEFLGDTVLQLIASEYLYKYFPEHHEGHLSLLRSSLVNNRTQAVVCNDLNMTEYAIYSKLKTDLKTKDRADLLEAFLGALYIDQGLDHCRKFCDVTFFPRLQQFIVNQEWNDPKSKLQQCCLTLRSMAGGEPDIPVYKVIECKGPTNTRVYTVAVYFRNKRLSKASGHSIQWAEMLAADKALQNTQELFPQLAYQKRLIAKNIHQNKKGIRPNHHSTFNQRKFRTAKNNKSNSTGRPNIIQRLPAQSRKSINDGNFNSNQSSNKYSDKIERDNTYQKKSPLKNTKVIRPSMKLLISSGRYKNRSVSVGAKSSFMSGYGNKTYKNNSVGNSSRGSHSPRKKPNLVSPPKKELSRIDSMPAKSSPRRQISDDDKQNQSSSSKTSGTVNNDKNSTNLESNDWSGVREKISVIAEKKRTTDYS